MRLEHGLGSLRVALAAALLLGVVQTGFAWPSAVAQLGVSGVVGALLVAIVGSLLPWTLIGAVFIALLEFVERVLDERSFRAARFVGPAITAILLLPYLWFVATFLFSGPRVRGLPVQPLLIGGAFLIFLASTFLMTRVLSSVTSLGRHRLIWGALALFALVSGMVLNLLVLPNEYEPLHEFVSWVAVASALCLARVVLRVVQGGRMGWIAPFVAILAVLSSARLTLESSHSVSWFVEGENVLTRYLPNVLVPEEEVVVGSDSGGEAPVGKIAWPNSKREAALREARGRRRLPHIVVFSVDNVQADRLGAYGYSGNPSTTNMDRIAREGVVFENAYTLYPGTRVFMSSMLMGRRLPPFRAHVMPKGFRELSLTRLLHDHGYHVLVKGVFELTASRKFNPDHYAIDTNLRRATGDEIRKSGTIPHIPYDERFQLIERHLKEAREKDAPAFLWMHWLQPHRFRGRFVPTEGFDFGKSLDGLYDSAIAGTDALIPRLERAMKEILPEGRDVIWVIMSDHGTGMTRGDKSDRGKTLYEDHIHVPLIIAGPGIAPGRIRGSVDAAVDVSATLLDWVGIAPPVEYDGTSLLPLLERRASSSALDTRFIALQSGSWLGAIQQRKKLILRKKSTSLFFLDQDPLEKKNLADEHPELVRSMKETLFVEQARMKKVMEASKPDPEKTDE